MNLFLKTQIHNEQQLEQEPSFTEVQYLYNAVAAFQESDAQVDSHLKDFVASVLDDEIDDQL